LASDSASGRVVFFGGVLTIAPVACSVAEALPSIAFVQGTIDDQARAGGMVARFIDGDDGSRILHEVLHQTRGYRCDFGTVPENTCLPSQVPGFGSTFADPGCTQELLGLYGTRPALTARFSSTCGVEPEYYEVGAELTPTTVYTNVSGICESRPACSMAYFRVGARVMADGLPQAMTAREGVGTLQAMRRVDGDGAPLGFPHRFWNPAIDRECYPIEAPDGSYRCLASDSMGTTQSWAEPTCMVTQLAEVSSCAMPGSHIFEYGPICIPGVRAVGGIFARGALHGSMTVYNELSSCRSLDIGGRSGSFFAVGPSVAPATLPELQLIIE